MEGADASPMFMKIQSVLFSLLASAVLGSANTASALQPPTTLTPGSVSAPGSSIATSSPVFTWTPVAGATGYGLYITDVANNTVVYPNLSGVVVPLSVPPFSLPGGYLPGGRAYSYTMTAFIAGVESAPSVPRYFQTSASSLQPPPVTAATSIGVSSFVANWNPVFALTNYVVDVSSSSTFSSFINGGQNIQVGTNKSVTINGLNSGVSYYYRVRGYSDKSTSGNSSVAKAITHVAPVPVPNAASPSLITSNSFLASWSSVVSAFGYRVDISASSNFDTFISGGQDLDVGNKLSLLVTGLNTNTYYYYRVRAYNNLGSSAPSAVIPILTLPVVPLAPVAFAPSTITSVSFAANWTLVSGASSYLLDVSTTSNFNTFVSGFQNLDVGNATKKSVTGVKSGTTYYYRVRARNTFGAGANSNTSSARTEPPLLLVKPQGASVVLSWPTNDPAFKLYYSTNLPPTTWLSNATSPSIVAGQYTVTNSVTNKARVYRLKR